MGSTLDKEQVSHTQASIWTLPDFNPCEPCPAEITLMTDTRHPPPSDKDNAPMAIKMNRKEKMQKRLENLLILPQTKTKQPFGENSIADSSGIDPKLLETAVNTIAKKFGVPPPRYRELSTCYHDGRFTTAWDEEFWHRVSDQVHHSAQACYLKYRELHGSDVARFIAPRICESKRGIIGCSAHDKEAASVLDARTTSTRKARRHSNLL